MTIKNLKLIIYRWKRSWDSFLRGVLYVSSHNTELFMLFGLDSTPKWLGIIRYHKYLISKVQFFLADVEPYENVRGWGLARLSMKHVRKNMARPSTFFIRFFTPTTIFPISLHSMGFLPFLSLSIHDPLTIFLWNCIWCLPTAAGVWKMKKCHFK